MKLTKEVANPRCLSYSIRNPAVFSLMKLSREVAYPRYLRYSICNPAIFSLSTRTRQSVLTFGGPRQEVVTKKKHRSRRAWKGDLGIEEEVVTCKLYLGLSFIILTLERVTIGCCEMGGGGVVGGVGVVCGDGVDRGVWC
ncbi:hypothetical protein Tco_1076356 [Tanacetum coccineum]